MANQDQVGVESGGGSSFLTAVCVDFIANPLDASFKARIPNYKNKEDPKFISNNKMIDRAPRNSIIAKVVSEGGSKINSDKLFLPFFPPYLSMPIKPGEQVWVMFEEPGNVSSAGYWICRKSTDVDTDDLNYTHLDRQNLYKKFRPYSADPSRPAGAPSPKDNMKGVSSSEAGLFSFPAGGGANTTNNTLEKVSSYKTIYEGALSIKQFAGEPVPRFSKKSPDFALQGSNNTLITLGTDRTATFDSSTSAGAGSIDIVAGRGQSESTAPGQVATNTRNFSEVNKVPLFSVKQSPNLNEGDPDFASDSARVYLSMKTEGDINFKTGATDLLMGTSLVLGFAAVNKTGPFVGLRSEHIRASTPAGGDIRLAAPGTTPLQNTSLTMEGTTGQAQIFGGTMAGLGTSTSAVICTPGMVSLVGALSMAPPPGVSAPGGGMAGIQATSALTPPPGVPAPLLIGDMAAGSIPSEPYVLWSKLEPFLRAIMEDLNGISSPLEEAPDGTPAPGLGLSAMNFDTLTIASTYEPMLAAMPSTTIFGE